jgi:hypothetical protein
MKYFEYLPEIEYSELAATNIMVRAKVRDFVLNNAAVYYLHRIEDGERPDTLATKYYGNASYTWLIFYANDIFDPIFDWPMTSEQLNAHLINTYGNLQVAQQTPHHYLLDNEYIIDRETFLNPNIPFNRKSLVTLYDHHFQINEAKRDIKLIDEVYSRQIVNEMKRLFL